MRARKIHPRLLGKRRLRSEAHRVQTRVSPSIKRLASRIPGKGVASVKQLANLVFKKTPVRESVENHNNRFRRTAADIAIKKHVDLLHCYERCHLMISALAAKEIPAWIVVEMDWQNFMHTYVEAMVGKEIYTIAFRTYEPPIVKKGTVEKAVEHAPGSSFVRGLDMGDLGVTNEKTFRLFAEKLRHGKVKGSIELK